MTRRVVEHLRRSDGQLLKVITIFEDGINKEKARRMVPYNKRHGVLLERREGYEWR